MSKVVQLPQRRERDPLLASLDSASLIGYERYLKWRLDCAWLVRGLEVPLFKQDENMMAYHERELKNEINFCIETLGKITYELRERSIKC